MGNTSIINNFNKLRLLDFWELMGKSKSTQKYSVQVIEIYKKYFWVTKLMGKNSFTLNNLLKTKEKLLGKNPLLKEREKKIPISIFSLSLGDFRPHKNYPNLFLTGIP